MVVEETESIDTLYAQITQLKQANDRLRFTVDAEIGQTQNEDGGFVVDADVVEPENHDTDVAELENDYDGHAEMGQRENDNVVDTEMGQPVKDDADFVEPENDCEDDSEMEQPENDNTADADMEQYDDGDDDGNDDASEDWNFIIHILSAREANV